MTVFVLDLCGYTCIYVGYGYLPAVVTHHYQPHLVALYSRCLPHTFTFGQFHSHFTFTGDSVWLHSRWILYRSDPGWCRWRFAVVTLLVDAAYVDSRYVVVVDSRLPLLIIYPVLLFTLQPRSPITLLIYRLLRLVTRFRYLPPLPHVALICYVAVTAFQLPVAFGRLPLPVVRYVDCRLVARWIL